jgi:hypothetical protein
VASGRPAEWAPRRPGVRIALIVVLGALVIAGASVLVLGAPWSTRHVTVVRVVTAADGGAAAYLPHHSYTGSGGAPAVVAPDPRAFATGSTPPSPSTPTPAASTGVLRGGFHASFARLSASLPGRVQIAVAPVGEGRIQTLGGDTPAHGWSTTKVPVLVALLRSRGRSGLTGAERQWAQAAITASDNQSVLDLFGDLERTHGGLIGASAYIQALFRASGDPQTIVATAPPPSGAVTTFGQTEWAPGQAVKFFRALGQGCLLSSSPSGYVLGLMENIVPGESWGLGAAGFTGPVAFKGGWGPEPSGAYLVRQSGIIAPGSPGAVAVSLVAYPGRGGDSFATGTQILSQTARWLRRELRLVSRPPAATCGGG